MVQSIFRRSQQHSRFGRKAKIEHTRWENWFDEAHGQEYWLRSARALAEAAEHTAEHTTLIINPIVVIIQLTEKSF